jgi:mannose-6-phosphate isomerase
MPPLRFRPILKRIRWGGRRLGTVLGKPVGNETDYAESWEISDHGAEQSVVVGEPYDGWTLQRLVREEPQALFGRHAGLEQFPLLVKFLDASDRLSLQVHPNDEQARRYDPRENGKTEAWVIVDAVPGSRLYAGLKRGVDRDGLRTHLAAGTVEECVHSFEVAPGDCVFIPAGTVHAIGEGILLAEIQQSSDLTFRLHDWGRVGQDGRPRALHVKESLACVDFERGPVGPAMPCVLREGNPREEELVRCPHFVIRRHRGTAAVSIRGGREFHILMLLQGSAELSCGGIVDSLRMGETMLVPADSPEVHIAPGEEMALLDAFLP